MPELPDIVAYIEALEPRIVGRPLEGAEVRGPFFLRTVAPSLDSCVGTLVRQVRRIGKRIVLGLDSDSFLVFHLMIAGRLRWLRRGAATAGRISVAWFDFPTGRLCVTEAAKKKRASLHVVSDAASLREFDAGGIEVLEADESTFVRRLRQETHTLKRALTDPRLLAGIGNAFSDEILHAARLSPVQMTTRLSDAEAARLYIASRETLSTWIVRLREQFAGAFPGPGEVTAFRSGFAVHGRFGLSCPVCGRKVQRIRYAENETNYCPTCQTGGKLLADRSLSRLLREDWPATVAEMEEISRLRSPS